MKICITGQGGEGKFPFGESGPWKVFEEAFLKMGFEITSGNYDQPSDAIIANYFNEQIEQYIFRCRIPRSNRVLILWEPYIVERTRYLESVGKLFGTILAPSIEWASRVGGHSFNWPQDPLINNEIFEDWSQRNRKAVMIQGNKFSSCEGELYSLRRRLLKKLRVSEVDLYGTNWNTGIHFDLAHWINSATNFPLGDLSFRSLYGVGRRYSNYRGVVSKKLHTLSSYQISIVIENSADFVSEKLFDSVRAGCITIYVGPELDKYGIPSQAVITPEPNADSIASTVRSLFKIDSGQRRDIAVGQWNALQSISEKWENQNVLKKLAIDIIRVLEKNEVTE